MLNVVTLVGRLTADPVAKTVGNEGVGMATFTLAVDNRTSDKSASFINCLAFRQTADIINRFTKKGSLIGIVGYLQQRRWEKDGQPRTTLEVVVDRVTLLGSKDKSETQEVKGNEDSSVNTIENLDDDSDLPF
ncbi:MAG: single-stranded DNA-binding protein [Erysipelotrichaceae bacterium]|jgi:single-strand DNA-binding protein|nr:single-stranded DNA-binding protein [Erysipelotrichaceae bacterium]